MRSKASTCAAEAREDFVDIFIFSFAVVVHARTSCPFTSTMQVSHVLIGPSCG